MTNDLFDSIKDDGVTEFSSFDTLETKIAQVLERIKALQAEKLELEKQARACQSKYDDAVRQIDELTRERDELRLNQKDPQQDELIRSKISALLAKLETA